MDGGPVTDLGNHGLTCLDGEDYAAIALYLQRTARTIEAALIDQQADLTAYTNRASILFTTTVTTTVITGSGQVMPDGRTATPTSFTGATVNGGGFSVASAGSTVVLTAARSGWYDFGGYCNLIAAGAVTVNSERLIYIQARQVPDPPATVSTITYQERSVDTNTGGENLVVAGLIYLLANRPVTLSQLVSHNNLASNVVTQIGAKMWLSFMGPQGAVVVDA